MATFLQTLSVLVAAAAVVFGVSSWRRSLIGQRRVDLAEKALDLFVQARDAIRMIRNPVGMVGEGSTRPKEVGETEEIKTLRDNAYVAIERYNTKSELFSELNSIKHRFCLYFGSEFADSFDVITTARDDIFRASMVLRDAWPRQGREPMSKEAFEAHIERMHKAEAVFWEGSEKEDPISGSIDDALATIDKACRDVIRPDPNFWKQCGVCWSWLVSYFSRP